MLFRSIDDLDATKAVLRLELFNLLRAVFFSSDDPGPAPNEDGDFTAAQMKPIFDRIDALFTCPKCSTADYYPELLAHTCRSSCASFSTGIYQYSSVYAQYARDLLNTIDPQPENGVESLGNCFSCKTCTPSLGNTCRTWIQMASGSDLTLRSAEADPSGLAAPLEIGRASCRERVS